MHRILASITTLEQHIEAGASGPDAYRPQACPHCRGCKLWGHGCYHRKADRRPGALGVLNPVAIARYLCAACLHTCSRLPLCIAPRRWYDWSVQQVILLMLQAGVSLHLCSRCTQFERRTIRRWRDWLDQRSEVFVFHLRSRFAELGRESDTPALWCNVMSAMGLGVAMAWLDQDLVVP